MADEKAPDWVRPGSMAIKTERGWQFVQPRELLFSTAVMAAKHFVAEDGTIKPIFEDDDA